MSKKRIGILTSGGDCPGLNAVIRGAVKASHQMGYDCVGFLKGYEGLYDPVQYVHLTPNSTRGILNQGGTILGSTNKGRFAATVGVDNRQELDPQLIEGVKQTIDQLSIDGLICVGGDGSLAVAQQFHENGIPVVGVPKTIDNDLSATAFTFGFDSAIECATDALDRLHTTAASHERIMVLEVMGRHAGWIALHSGIAGGGDVILLPEIPWTWDHLCHKILHRESQGKKFTLVVVAEGAELPGGDLVGEERSGQQMKLGGVGRAVTEEIERRLHRETRLSVLGHLQRGGKPTTFDRVLATQFGAHAVRLVHEGRFGEMICSRPPEMNSVPIMEAVNVLRRVDPHGPAVQAARALGISFGDRAADEVGQNVFNLQETLPLNHVVDNLSSQGEEVDSLPLDEALAVDTPTLEEALAETLVEEVEVTAEVVEEAVEPAEEIAVEAAEEETLPEADVAETPAEEEPVAEIDDEVIVEEPTEEPAAEETAAVEESVEEIEPIAEEATEEVAEVVAEVIEEAAEEGPAAEPVAEVAEELAEEPAAEVTELVEEPVAEAAAGSEPAADEDTLAEEVVETVLDMSADADAAIHGLVADAELEEPAVEAESEDEPAEVELPETDSTAEETAEPVATEEEAEEEAPAPLEEPVAEPSAALEVEDEVAAEPAPATPDLTAMQDSLAAQIAAAAKDSRDDVPEDTAVGEDLGALSVAELVQQKLAAATEEVKEAEPVAAAEEPSVLEEPHGEDLVAEARAALEDALAD